MLRSTKWQNSRFFSSVMQLLHFYSPFTHSRTLSSVKIPHKRTLLVPEYSSVILRVLVRYDSHVASVHNYKSTFSNISTVYLGKKSQTVTLNEAFSCNLMTVDCHMRRTWGFGFIGDTGLFLGSKQMVLLCLGGISL